MNSILLRCSAGSDSAGGCEALDPRPGTLLSQGKVKKERLRRIGIKYKNALSALIILMNIIFCVVVLKKEDHMK